MVKKKSFWFILLAVLTAAVMVFCACGLVGCSSESDEDDNDDNTQQGGGTGGGSTEDDGSFTVWGITNLFGSWWSSYTFDPDGTGFFALYNEDGSLESHSSEISRWEYVDDTHINATMHITRDEDIDITLMKVDGKIVAASVYTVDYDSEDYFYETSVLGALDSTDDVDGAPAQLVLYKDFSSVAVINDAVSYGEWAWTTEDASLTVTIGTSSYSATVTENSHGQITQADFDKFSTASNVTFIQMGTVDATLYSFVSEEGYTLVMDREGNFETVVDGKTYTGSGNTTTLALADDENDTTYTPTLEKDSDGNVVSATYETYFGEKTDVVFYLPENVPVSVYDQFLAGTYNGDTRGDAVAVFTGIKVKDDESGTAVQIDDVAYWIFLYRDGSFVAHIYADYMGYGKTDGNWTWATNDESELVPTFIRNPGKDTEQVNYAVDNGDGTYSVAIENSASRTTDAETGESVLTGAYFVYTFALEDMPAGVFEGSTEGNETTYVVILYGDGTFRCHVPQTGAMPQYGTSTGFWSKDENGDMTFYKTSSGSISALCEVNAYLEDGEDTGKLEVQITNSQGTVYTYVVDPSIVPVGGHELTDDDNAKIAELEAVREAESNFTAALPVTIETTDTIEPSMFGGAVSLSGMTITFNEGGTGSLTCSLYENYTNWTWSIIGATITIKIDMFGGSGTGTVNFDENGDITSIVFTSFAGDDYANGITFTPVSS